MTESKATRGQCLRRRRRRGACGFLARPCLAATGLPLVASKIRIGWKQRVPGCALNSDMVGAGPRGERLCSTTAPASATYKASCPSRCIGGYAPRPTRLPSRSPLCHPAGAGGYPRGSAGGKCCSTQPPALPRNSTSRLRAPSQAVVAEPPPRVGISRPPPSRVHPDLSVTMPLVCCSSKKLSLRTPPSQSRGRGVVSVTCGASPSPLSSPRSSSLFGRARL